MSDKGFDIDTEAVREAAGKLRFVRGDFDEVAEYTTEADPDWWMWGFPGMIMSQQYGISAALIRAILCKFGPAVDGLATRIESACEEYGNADGTTSDEMCAADGELDQTGSSDV